MTNVPAGSPQLRKIAHAVLVTSALIAAAYAFWPTSQTDAVSQAAEQRAQMDIVVKVPAYAKMEGITTPDSVEVTAGHIAQGYVDIVEPSKLTVSFNTRQGFALVVAFDTEWVSKLDLTVDGRSSLIEEPNARITVMRDIGIKREVDLRYRLFLSRSARPGQYAWPVAINVSPPV